MRRTRAADPHATEQDAELGRRQAQVPPRVDREERGQTARGRHHARAPDESRDEGRRVSHVPQPREDPPQPALGVHRRGPRRAARTDEHHRHPEERDRVEPKRSSRSRHGDDEPPNAGPSARARFTDTPPSVTAAGRRRRGTASDARACQMGSSTALPRPMANANPMRSAGLIRPAHVRSAIAAVNRKSHICVPMASRLRSTMSASVPAGSARSSIAAPSAAWSIATSRGDRLSDVISHPSPTSCISAPKFETRPAIQSARNAL